MPTLGGEAFMPADLTYLSHRWRGIIRSTELGQKLAKMGCASTKPFVQDLDAIAAPQNQAEEQLARRK